MDKNIEFRKAMRGYNTEDVNRFISEENVRFNRLEENYLKTIEEKDKTISDLSDEINVLKQSEQKICDLNIKIELLESHTSQLNTIIEEKDSIIDGLKTALHKANEKSFDIEKESRNRVVSIVDPDIEIYREKAEKYDAIYNQVDEILNFAKAEAEKIIKEATEYKMAVQRNSKKESDSFKASINTRSDSIIDDLKKSIRKQLKAR